MIVFWTTAFSFKMQHKNMELIKRHGGGGGIEEIKFCEVSQNFIFVKASKKMF